MKLIKNSKFKKSNFKKQVQSEPRPLHAYFLDADDVIKNSAIGNVMCMDLESARVTLLRYQFANGGPAVKRLTASV